MVQAAKYKLKTVYREVILISVVSSISGSQGDCEQRQPLTKIMKNKKNQVYLWHSLVLGFTI
jgi:hypothetical protein